MEPFEHLWNPHSKLSNIASDEIMKKKKKYKKHHGKLIAHRRRGKKP